MKLPIPCPECLIEASRSEIKVEPNNEGQFEATCDSGHTFKLSVAYLDFQILFEIAVHAICDGYYRESIGSFTASYERFLAFFVRIIAEATGVDSEPLEKSWKKVSAQSERQLGAYVLVYLLTYNEVPPVLPPAQVNFRNEVIHKGLIPTRQKCLEYGDAVTRVIFKVLRMLWASNKDQVVRSANKNLRPSTGEKTHIFFPWLTIATTKEPPAEGEEPSIESLVDTIERRNAANETNRVET